MPRSNFPLGIFSHVSFMILVGAGVVSGATGIQFPAKSVVAPGGTFEFDNIIGTYSSDKGVTLHAVVKNNTSRYWSRAMFSVRFKDGKGAEHVPDARISLEMLSLYWFAPGKSEALRKGKGWLFEFSQKVRDLADMEIAYHSGEFRAQYLFGLVKPVESDALAIEDDLVSITLSLPWTEYHDTSGVLRDETHIAGIGLEIANKSDDMITLDWNQVSFIDPDGNSRGVIHGGVRYIQSDAQQSASTIPPAARIQDVIVPKGSYRFAQTLMAGKEWIIESLVPRNMPEAASWKGKTFSVFLPMTMKGQSRNYMMTVIVKSVE